MADRLFGNREEEETKQAAGLLNYCISISIIIKQPHPESTRPRPPSQEHSSCFFFAYFTCSFRASILFLFHSRKTTNHSLLQPFQTIAVSKIFLLQSDPISSPGHPQTFLIFKLFRVYMRQASFDAPPQILAVFHTYPRSSFCSFEIVEGF